MQAAAQTVDKLRNGCRFRFEDGLHHQLAGGIQNCRRDRCLMNIQPNILGIIHEGAPFCRRRCERSKPTPKGRPFIMRLPTVTSLLAIRPKAMPSMPDESVVNDPYNLSLRIGILKVTEALPSSSCFTLGIPSGLSARSHSTTRAISSTRRFPAAIGVEGAFKQAKRPVRLCRAEQVKYARLQHRL